jgi:hypothetical protein
MGMVYGQHSTRPPDAFLDIYKTRIMGLLLNSKYLCLYTRSSKQANPSNLLSLYI